MSVEGETVSSMLDSANKGDDRRASSERRGRERRKAANRVNMAAPRKSLMMAFGAYGVALIGTVFILTLIAGEMIGTRATVVAIGFEAAAFITSILLLALGSLELRLIEIRLELMMMNGGMRGGDRRQVERRDAPPESASDRRSA